MPAPHRPFPGPLPSEKRGADRGSAMILAVLVLGLITALAAIATSLAVGNLRGSASSQQAGTALDAAEAGVSQAATYIRTNGTRKLRCYPATCTTNPWNPTAPVSASVAGGGGWTAYIQPIPPNTAAQPGRFLIHSEGTAAGSARRIIETEVSVAPIDLPKAIFGRTITGGGTVNISKMSVLSTGCVYKRDKLSMDLSAGFDLAYGVPPGVHSSQIITESQGSGQYCPNTAKPVHKGLNADGTSKGPCNSTYPNDQDRFGGSLTGLPDCATAASNYAYQPRDLDADGKLDINGSFLRDDRALFAAFGIDNPALSDAELEQLRTTSQAQGNHYTSTSGWALPTSPHSVLFFDLNGGTVGLDPLGSSIFARTTLDAGDSLCEDKSLLVVIVGGNAKMNGNMNLAASIYLASKAPYGVLTKANGTVNVIGMLYADTLDLTGNLSVSLDTCYLENLPAALFSVTPGTYRELDR